MTPTMFLACPLTAARDLVSLDGFVIELRRTFVAAGWGVRPDAGLQARMTAAHRATSARALVAANVRAVISSDLLVVLVPETQEPSSIWVELGMALAFRLPIIVIGKDDNQLPYLARLAVKDEPDGHHKGIRVSVAVPPARADAEAVIEKVISTAAALVGAAHPEGRAE